MASKRTKAQTEEATNTEIVAQEIPSETIEAVVSESTETVIEAETIVSEEPKPALTVLQQVINHKPKTKKTFAV